MIFSPISWTCADCVALGLVQKRSCDPPMALGTSTLTAQLGCYSLTTIPDPLRTSDTLPIPARSCLEHDEWGGSYSRHADDPAAATLPTDSICIISASKSLQQDTHQLEDTVSHP